MTVTYLPDGNGAFTAIRDGAVVATGTYTHCVAVAAAGGRPQPAAAPDPTFVMSGLHVIARLDHHATSRQVAHAVAAFEQARTVADVAGDLCRGATHRTGGGRA